MADKTEKAVAYTQQLEWQRKMADMLGLPGGSMDLFESQKVTPTKVEGTDRNLGEDHIPPALAALAAALGMSPEEIWREAGWYDSASYNGMREEQYLINENPARMNDALRARRDAVLQTYPNGERLQQMLQKKKPNGPGMIQVYP